MESLATNPPDHGTRVLTGRDAVLGAVTRFLTNAESRMDLCTGILAPNQAEGTEEMAKAYFDIAKRGGRLRLIGRITKENVDYCKELTKAIEVRHKDDVSVYFGVSDAEYIALPGTQEFNPDSPLLYSNDELFVKHQQNLFDMLWDAAVPADIRLTELEKGATLGRTKITFSTQEIFESANRFVDETKEEALIIASTEGSLKRNAEFFQRILSKARAGGVRVKILGRFSKDETGLMREFISSGVQVRALAPGGIKNLALGIYDRKSMGVVQYIYPESQTTQSGRPYLSGIISTESRMIEWVADFFESLWENSATSEDALAQIEQGIEPPMLRIISDPLATQRLLSEVVQKSRSSVLLLLPSTNEFHREEKIGVIDSIREASLRGVKVRILSPLDELVKRDLDSLAQAGAGMIEYMGAPPARSATPVTVLVVDGTASLVAELKDDSKADFADAVGVASYSARNSTVLANVRFFERTWEAIELVKAEERSRKTAELMQDILVHDIRNFNQITRANVELLRDRLTDEKLRGFAEWALDSIDGATELIQKTRTLANVISGENVSLTPVDLSESVERSLSLVGKVFRDKRVELSSRLPPEARVLADSLLDQVFVNILSNAVKYTDGSVVPLEIQLEERDEMLAEGSGKQRCWLVTITDQGRGIPDEMKESAAMRYLGTAKGRGLGLSIAHALVVNRYAGKMQIRNRVESNHSKGTRVEVWLPKA